MKAACGWCILCLVAICCVTSSNARADRWLCDTKVAGHPYKQEWIISGDRMWAPKGKGFIRVLKNDENILVASHTFYYQDGTRYTTHYIVIEKHAGTMVELNDFILVAVADLGPAAWVGATPTIDVGHCVVDPRPTPAPPTLPWAEAMPSTTGPTASPTPQSPTAEPLSLAPANPGPERQTALERQKDEQRQKADRTVELYKPLVDCVKRRAHSNELYSSAESADVVARAAVGEAWRAY